MIATQLPAPDLHRARQIVDGFTRTNVLVIGDLMLDRFLVGRVTRISPEAPVPVVAFARQFQHLGGAANVAHNVRALGGEATLVGVIGKDEAGHQVVDICNAARIKHSIWTDESRPTTTKVRIVTDRNQQVARIDYEADTEVSESIEAMLVDEVERSAQRSGVIVISDYLKGCVTRAVVAAAISAGQRRGIPVLVDPKIPHLDYYTGASVITPNHHEAEIATHRRIRSHEDACAAAREFRDKTQCTSVLITRGDQGMWLLGSGVEGYLLAAEREVADVTGAGDTVIATLALAIAATATLPEAAWLANHAAGVVVGKFGPATVTSEELLDKSQIPNPKSQPL